MIKADPIPIGQKHFSFTENLTKPYFQRASRTETLTVLLKYKRPNEILIAQCGYKQSHATDDLDELEALLTSKKMEGPAFIHMRIKKGSPKELRRPKIKPFEVKDRLMRYITTQMS